MTCEFGAIHSLNLLVHPQCADLEPDNVSHELDELPAWRGTA